MKNIFIIPKGLSAGVINSQMLEIVSNLNVNGEKENYIIVPEADIKKIPNFDDVYNSLLVYLFKQMDIDHLYVRSISSFIPAYFSKKVFFKKYKIIYDYRGIDSEESYLRNKSNLRKKILCLIEQFIYNKADEIHTVSINFKEYLKKRFGQKEIKVIPCAISENIWKSSRDKEHIGFVYLGSASVWQKLEETVKLYSYIEKKLKNTKLTIITLDKDTAIDIVNKYDILNCEIKSLSHKKVLKELNNYDFGFLLRDDNIVNHVASPIKFLEYISNGVIPIMTNNIGDYSKIAVDNHIGIILDNKFHIDFKRMNVLWKDKDIFLRMKRVSDDFLWENVLNNFFDDKNEVF